MGMDVRSWIVGGLWVSALVVIMRDAKGFSSILAASGTAAKSFFQGVQGGF